MIILSKIVEDCEATLRCSNSCLDKWTREKMESLIQSYYEYDGRLTPRQEKFLRDLWEKI